MQASIKSTLKKYSSIYFRPLVSDEISSVDADFNSSSEALPTGWCMVHGALSFSFTMIYQTFNCSSAAIALFKKL